MISDQRICSNCGSLGTEETITKVKGSGWITFILLCCYIVPGIIYWIWRYSEKITICRSCKSDLLLEINSPKGKEIYEKYHTKS
jgi:hypothetical protein